MSVPKKWSIRETEFLRRIYTQLSDLNCVQIARLFPKRNHRQIWRKLRNLGLYGKVVDPAWEAFTAWLKTVQHKKALPGTREIVGKFWRYESTARKNILAARVLEHMHSQDITYNEPPQGYIGVREALDKLGVSAESAEKFLLPLNVQYFTRGQKMYVEFDVLRDRYEKLLNMMHTHEPASRVLSEVLGTKTHVLKTLNAFHIPYNKYRCRYFVLRRDAESAKAKYEAGVSPEELSAMSGVHANTFRRHFKKYPHTIGFSSGTTPYKPRHVIAIPFLQYMLASGFNWTRCKRVLQAYEKLLATLLEKEKACEASDRSARGSAASN